MAKIGLYPKSVKPGIPKLGKCPQGWTRTTFGAKLKIITRDANILDDDKYELVIAKRNRGGVVSRGVKKGKEIKTKTQFVIKNNDFLISKRQIIHGACGLVPPELDGAIVSNEYSVLNAKPDLSLKYLDYFSHTIYFQQTCFQSSVGVDVEKMIFRINEWLKYPFYLPPLPEQHKIVEILNTWDEAIAKTEALIAALEQRKKGLMQRVLTGEVRFPGFTDPWREVRLDTYIDNFIVPMRDKPKNFSGNIPWCRIEDLEGIFLSDSKSNKYVNQKTINSMNLKVYPIGTILCSCSADLGRCAITTKPLVTNQTFIGLVPKKNLDPIFLYYYLTFHSQQLQRYSSGTTISYLSRKEFEILKVTIPGLIQEQNKISKILIQIDQKIDNYKKQKKALIYQKKGLMQCLLTGQVRVHPGETHLFPNEGNMGQA